MQEITKNYDSDIFKNIRVENIEGEIIVTITNRDENESIYSWYDLTEKESYSVYINKCLLGGLIKGIPKKVLVIGFGGGSFIKFLEDHFENIEITGIDIEPIMKNICEDIMGVKTKKLIIGDANLVLDNLISENKKYDLILFDVYGSSSEIPENLTKKVFFEKTKKVLEKDGIFSINMSNFQGVNKTYHQIHDSLKSLFGEEFTLFQSGKQDISNCMGIYNLDKNYTALDYDKNYRILFRKGLAEFSSEITKNTCIDEERKFLN